MIVSVIGVALGIPAALWISNLQEKSSEKEYKRKILPDLALYVLKLTLMSWQQREAELSARHQGMADDHNLTNWDENGQYRKTYYRQMTRPLPSTSDQSPVVGEQVTGK